MGLECDDCLSPAQCCWWCCPPSATCGCGKTSPENRRRLLLQVKGGSGRPRAGFTDVAELALLNLLARNCFLSRRGRLATFSGEHAIDSKPQWCTAMQPTPAL